MNVFLFCYRPAKFRNNAALSPGKEPDICGWAAVFIGLLIAH